MWLPVCQLGGAILRYHVTPTLPVWTVGSVGKVTLEETAPVSRDTQAPGESRTRVYGSEKECLNCLWTVWGAGVSASMSCRPALS